ncbi:unnamed protein product, partial [Iphiclides podalirius]
MRRRDWAGSRDISPVDAAESRRLWAYRDAAPVFTSCNGVMRGRPYEFQNSNSAFRTNAAAGPYYRRSNAIRANWFAERVSILRRALYRGPWDCGLVLGGRYRAPPDAVPGNSICLFRLQRHLGIAIAGHRESAARPGRWLCPRREIRRVSARDKPLRPDASGAPRRPRGGHASAFVGTAP